MWYNKIVENVSNIPAMIDHYDLQLTNCAIEVKIRGSLEINLARLPGQVEARFAELQEIEAILNYLNIELRKLRRIYFQKYTENYNKALTSRDVDKYVDGEQAVCDFEMLINEVALLRNRYLAVHKAFEAKGFVMNNITKLRCAGLENISVNDK